jgi:probable F420-dependent oxidoreductase
MEFDLMTAGSTWSGNAELAQQVEGAGFSGMLWTEIHQVPWMQIAAAAMAAPSLTFTTGIAVAFPRSPMLTAQVAWELAGNTGGRFRLGLGSQVKAHITRRYATTYDQPAERMRDYVAAVKACLRAFRGEEKLSHEGPFYQLTLLPGWAVPPAHDFGDVKVDISAVGPLMVKVAAELADGVHVHPLHSMPYLHNRLLPALAEAAKGVGRDPAEVDLIVPVFIVPGDTPEEREALARRARGQIAFYGTTPNYSFQFDDLGYEGMTAKLGERLRAGDTEGMADLITDEMLDHFAVVGTWDEVVAKLRERYTGVAARVVSYLGEDQIRSDPAQRSRWGELARAVRG